MAVFNAVIFTELNMISVSHKTLQNQKETDFRLRFKTNEKNNPKIDFKKNNSNNKSKECSSAFIKQDKTTCADPDVI